MNNVKIIISLILIILLIIYKIMDNKKYKPKKTYLYNKEKKINIFLIIFSIIAFMIVLGVSLENDVDVITSITNALCIAMILFPINLLNLYNSMFKDEEKYCNIKTVITNIIDEEIVAKLKKAHINTIIISDKKNKSSIEIISEKEINRNILHKNIIINSNNIKILDKMIDKDVTLYETKNLNKLYEKLMEARMVYDNYIRIIKYLVITYLPLILSYFLLIIEGFPYKFELILVVLLKIFSLLTVNLLYKYLPYDKDVEERYSKKIKCFMGSQEVLFIIVQSFIVLFLITLPYMYIMAQGGSVNFAFTLYIIIFIYSNLLGTYSMINDSFIVKIFWKFYRNIRLVIFSIVLVIFTILINYIHIFDTINIGLQNYFSCVCLGIATIAINEFIKLARYASKKGSRKNELKNN